VSGLLNGIDKCIKSIRNSKCEAHVPVAKSIIEDWNPVELETAVSGRMIPQFTDHLKRILPIKASQDSDESRDIKFTSTVYILKEVQMQKISNILQELRMLAFEEGL